MKSFALIAFAVWTGAVFWTGASWKESTIEAERYKKDFETAAAIVTRQAENYERTIQMANTLGKVTDNTHTGPALGIMLDSLQPKPGQ